MTADRVPARRVIAPRRDEAMTAAPSAVTPAPRPELALLRERVAAIPHALRDMLEAPRAEHDVRALPDGAEVIVTGIGLSEGPARALVALLCHLRGVRARFAPLSAFSEPPRGDALVLFSQGLCPNARMALRTGDHYAQRWLLTGAPPRAAAHAALVEQARARGFVIVGHPPSSEPGLLLRVLGPAAATLAALRFACPERDLSELPARVAAAASRATEALTGEVAFVTAHGYDAYCHGLAWKWHEGLYRPPPPIWDALQVVHGPLQSFYERPQTLLALCHEGAATEARLFDRLESLLVPGRHKLVRLTAAGPAPLGLLEHDAMVNQLLLQAIAAADIDLSHWPAKDRDGAIYGLEAL